MQSPTIILPGEDPEEFRGLRHDLFRTFQPRTGEEARCVETIAGLHWRTARCHRWQDNYDGKLDDLHYGNSQGPDGEQAGPKHCETDPHRWMHKSVDCVQQADRMDRLIGRTQKRLLDLQALRRRNLIAGAIDTLADWRDFEREGEAALGLGQPLAAGAEAAATDKTAEPVQGSEAAPDQADRLPVTRAATAAGPSSGNGSKKDNEWNGSARLAGQRGHSGGVSAPGRKVPEPGHIGRPHG